MVDKEPKLKRGRFFAAIDLGSNACRLHVGKLTAKGFIVVKTSSKIVSLARLIKDNNGELTEEIQDKAIRVLSKQKQLVQYYNAEYVRCVATAACRLAVNGSEFVAKVNSALGINLEIISPMEEARLALLGCTSMIKHFVKRVIIIDVGGGSTEVAYAQLVNNAIDENQNYFQMVDYRSLQEGMLTLRDAYDTHIVNVFDEVVGKVSLTIANFIKKNNLKTMVERGECKVICCSGSSNILNQVQAIMNKPKIRVKNYYQLDVSDLEAFVTQLKLNEGNNVTVPGLFTAGSAIMKGIIDALGSRSVIITNKGVKDGLLQDIYNNNFNFVATPDDLYREDNITNYIKSANES